MSRREPIAAVVGALIVAFLAPLVPPVQRTHADPSDVVIAEFMASNSSTLFDEDGAASDWIELWNRSADTVDLAGWQLSDSGATWTFPSVELAGGARLVVFASDKDGLHPLHTNFKLGASNDRIVLRDPSAAVVSQYAPTYPAQTSNISYGLGSNDVVGYLATPTPGEPNSAAASGTSAKPVLSASGGYLAEPIELTATTTTAGATLYYTTDGSTPSAGNGTEYVGPITIAATTTLRMVASRPDFFDSKVASATFLVMDELLAQTGVPAGWPAGPVNDQLFGYGFDPAAVEAHGAAIESSLLAVPTLSILTDQANLTDPATGIYTNARESGSAWERPVSVEYLDGVDGFQLNGGLRIKGGFSRTPLNPKHSFRLYFEPEYEGALTYPLFDSGTIQTFTNLDLRTEQNYGWQFSSDRGTHLRDAWLRESAAAMGNPTSRSQWVHLFLNGQYWGVYMLKDRITADHMSRLYGGDEDDYDVIKHADNYAYEVNDGDDDEWQDVWTAVADGTLDDQEFATVGGLVDLANLADFWLLNAVAGNQDAAPSAFLTDERGNNWYAAGGNGQPFRFFVDDGEHILGASDHDPTISRIGPFPILDDNPDWSSYYFHPGWLHEVLLTRPEYRAILSARAQLALSPGGALDSATATSRWVALRQQADLFIDADAARWGNFGGQSVGRPHWQTEVDWVEQQWLPVRAGIVRNQLILAGLMPSPSAIDSADDSGLQPAVRLAPPSE